jgi:hypothetical protein
MTEKAFVPELHDLGKLIAPDISGIPTTDGELMRHGRGAFGDINWQAWGVAEPTTLTWAAIRHHHDDGRGRTNDWRVLPSEVGPDWPTRVAVFLVTIADHLAATTGRALGERQPSLGRGPGDVYCLWRPGMAQELGASPFPIRDGKELQRALELVRRPRQSFESYRQAYGHSMMVRAEDMEQARGVTSLLSHLTLVGQYYRVLSEAVGVDTDMPGLSLAGQTANTVRAAERKWVGRLVRVQVRFHQQPVRPADLGVFDRLTDCHGALEHTYPNHLLFRAGDTLWLFLPGPEPGEGEAGLATQSMLDVYLAQGFYAEAHIREAPLKRLGVWFSREMARDLQQGLDQDLEQEEVRIHAEMEAVQAEIQALSTRMGELVIRIPEAASVEERQALGEKRSQLDHRKKEKAKTLHILEGELAEVRETMGGLPGSAFCQAANALSGRHPRDGRIRAALVRDLPNAAGTGAGVRYC